MKAASIEFRDVGFHFPTEQGATARWVLRHVSFMVPAGGTLAVVGATGSGKSALIDLIPRTGRTPRRSAVRGGPRRPGNRRAPPVIAIAHG